MAKKDSKSEEYEIKDHQLSASKLSLWMRLLRENKIDKEYRKMKWRIWMFVIFTQPFQWIQNITFNRRIRKIDYSDKPPLFILGHWRSGTTFLHYLMAQDNSYGYVSNYQAFLMRVSLLGNRWLMKLLAPLMPDKRPQDNIKVDIKAPQEEEQPLSNYTHRSGIHVFYFPNNHSYFDKYNLFQGISEKEVELWKRDYLQLLGTVTIFNNYKPILLKNPHNTSRVKQLVEMFPNSKFIYIHRNPYEVYHSTKHLYKKAVSTQFLQSPDEETIENTVFYCYKETLQKYLRERHLIPKENLVEISFKELENTPLETIKRIYEEIGLTNFTNSEESFKKHIASVSNYKKNKFPELPKVTVDRINSEWDFAFKEWGYDKIID